MSAARNIERRNPLTSPRAILLLTSLLLAGCAHDRLPPAGPAEFASESFSREHEIHFAKGRTTLSAVDRERLGRFLTEADPEGDGGIVVSVAPSHDERLMQLQALLLSEGRQVSGRIDPDQPDNRAVLSLERDLALPTRCAGDGLWDSDIAKDGEGLPLGCTTSMNLSAMIDDPRDLTQGRPLGPAAAAPAADLARAYLSRFADPLAEIDEGEVTAPTPPEAPDAPRQGP